MLAHDFKGSRGRQAHRASLEARWHGVGLLVCGEAGMLTGLIFAQERESGKEKRPSGGREIQCNYRVTSRAGEKSTRRQH